MQDDWFESEGERSLFKLVAKHINEFKACPSQNEIEVELSDVKLDEHAHKAAHEMLKEVCEPDWLKFVSQAKPDWLLAKCEKWCRDRAIFTALMKSVQILDQDPKAKLNLDRGAIPKLLSDALMVSFNKDVGHHYVDDWQNRFATYSAPEFHVPFRLEWLNAVTNGGVTPKTLNLFVAGCVHPDTQIKIRLKRKTCVDRNDVPTTTMDSK